MKYMHFRASCAYTALAEMLKAKEIDTEDYQIALEMKLPWLFAKEEDSFVSGTMLQGAKWFDLWLVPHGYTMIEKSIDREELCDYLQTHYPSMVGIKTPYGKHAVVCKKYNQNFSFFNPTYENSNVPFELILTREKLISAVDEIAVVGELYATDTKVLDLSPLLRESISVVRENCAEIVKIASNPHNPDDYLPMMNKIFRPLLLDGISMLELAGKSELAQEFSAIQSQFLGFMRGNRMESMEKAISIKELLGLAEEYIKLIQLQL